MPLKTTKFIWHEGRLVPWEQATVHVLSHALHYGSSVFEGIRVYQTPNGAVGFRLTDHIRRLFQSAKIYRMKIPSRREAITAACREVVSENGLSRARTSGRSRFAATARSASRATSSHPLSVSIAAWEWGAYLGDGALEQGVDVCVSSWQRVAPNTVPALAKAGGNYLSSALVSARGARGSASPRASRSASTAT